MTELAATSSAWEVVGNEDEPALLQACVASWLDAAADSVDGVVDGKVVVVAGGTVVVGAAEVVLVDPATGRTSEVRSAVGTPAAFNVVEVDPDVALGGAVVVDAPGVVVVVVLAVGAT